MERLKKLLSLYWSFFKIGAMTFGGGYAMLPMLEREIVENKKWATQEEILNYFAVGQCTPGVIAVNTATFVGYNEEGVLGGIFATLGVVSPSIVIITVIAMVLSQISHITWVQHAFGGIRVAVAALILASVIKLFKSSVKNAVGLILCIIAFVLVAVLGASPLYIVIGAAIVGIVMGYLPKKAGESK